MLWAVLVKIFAVVCQIFEFIAKSSTQNKYPSLRLSRTFSDQAKGGVDNETLTKLLHELSEQQKQTHRDFDQLKEENQDLYRQVGRLRQKHDKQQDTVQRLITFMIHYFQSAQKEVLLYVFLLGVMRNLNLVSFVVRHSIQLESKIADFWLFFWRNRLTTVFCKPKIADFCQNLPEK